MKETFFRLKVGIFDPRTELHYIVRSRLFAGKNFEDFSKRESCLRLSAFLFFPFSMTLLVLLSSNTAAGIECTHIYSKGSPFPVGELHTKYHDMVRRRVTHVSIRNMN